MATKPVFDDVAPWPEQKSALPPRDHNQPPIEERIPVEFREALLAERGDFLVKLDQLLGTGDPNSEEFREGSVHRAKCVDDDTLGKCGELVKALRACEQLVDKVHVDQKAPHLLAGRLVDAEKNTFRARIMAGKSTVQALMDEYADEQLRLRRKREAEEAAQREKLTELARENNLEHALPPPPPPQKAAPVRSDGGVSVSLGTEFVSTVTDYAKAFRKVKDNAKVREAIDAAIKRLVNDAKGKIDIPGVTITERAKTSAR